MRETVNMPCVICARKPRCGPFHSPLSSLFTGENLVPEPADEVEELQGTGAAVVRRLPRADAAHQSQSAPGPERRGQEVLSRRRGGRGRRVQKREDEGGRLQHLLSISFQQALGLLRVRRRRNNSILIYFSEEANYRDITRVFVFI